MNIEALKTFCKETIITYPTLTSEITEYYELALMEIEECVVYSYKQIIKINNHD